MSALSLPYFNIALKRPNKVNTVLMPVRIRFVSELVVDSDLHELTCMNSTCKAAQRWPKKKKGMFGQVVVGFYCYCYTPTSTSTSFYS